MRLSAKYKDRLLTDLLSLTRWIHPLDGGRQAYCETLKMTTDLGMLSRARTRSFISSTEALKQRCRPRQIIFPSGRQGPPSSLSLLFMLLASPQARICNSNYLRRQHNSASRITETMRTRVCITTSERQYDGASLHCASKGNETIFTLPTLFISMVCDWRDTLIRWFRERWT